MEDHIAEQFMEEEAQSLGVECDGYTITSDMWEQLAECYHSEAEFTSSWWQGKPSDFIKVASKKLEAVHAEGGEQKHVTSNHWIEINGDRATAECDLILFVRRPINGVLIDLLGNVTVPGTLIWEGGTLGAGGVDISGNFRAQGAIVAGQGTADQVGLQSHDHTSATPGAPTSAPRPGT